MKDKEKLKGRFLRDPLPIRLGNLSATLGRISSTARKSLPSTVIVDLLYEAKCMIEWTAEETEPEIAYELIQMQRLITSWESGWEPASNNQSLRAILVASAKDWSDRTLDFSGLLD